MDETDIKVVTNGTNATSFGSSLDNKLLAVQSTNFFIFYVFFNNKSILKKTRSNRLILSLSVPHFLAGLVYLGKTIKQPLLRFPDIKI